MHLPNYKIIRTVTACAQSYLREWKMIKPPRIRLPHCTDGAMNSAFEDVGGIWGYQSMLEVIKNPDNPEYAEQLEWILESFGKRLSLARN